MVECGRGAIPTVEGDKMKTAPWFAVFLGILLLTGCASPEKPRAAIIQASLESATIVSGGSTNLILDAKDTGKVPATVKFTVTTEAPDKVGFSYPAGLEFTLQPEETTGKKLIKVTGTSETIKTSYRINIFLVDSQGTPYDQREVILDVTKGT